MSEPQPLGDHPHNDPNDGRTECDTCGKWVHECIHSCKGIPVTEAARQRAYARQPDVIGFGQWEKCGGPCCGGSDTSEPPRPRRVRPPRPVGQQQQQPEKQEQQ